MKWTRGYIAKKLKINLETLRYYEKQKLIKKPLRLLNNYRNYDDEDIMRLQFIIMAKELGFSLKEIKDLLNLSITEKSDRKKVRALVSSKSNIIENKIKQLTKIKVVLTELILLCHTNKTASHCPILKSLYQK